MHLNINKRSRGRMAAAVSASAVLALGVAACGSRRFDSSEAESGGDVSGDVSLVAYSTPQDVYEEDARSRLPGRRRLRGRPRLLVRLLGRSVPRGRGRRTGRPRPPRARARHDASRRRRCRRRGLGGRRGRRSVRRPRSSRSPSAAATRRTSRTGTTSSATTSQVVTPNPFTSGGASWNIMAAYGQALENGGTEEEALALRRRRPGQHRRSRTQARPTRWRRSSAARATC